MTYLQTIYLEANTLRLAVKEYKAKGIDDPQLLSELKARYASCSKKLADYNRLKASM